MTEAEFLDVLMTWQDRLGLNRWDIELKLDHPDIAPSEHSAFCYPSPDYDLAVIQVAHGWQSWERKKVNRVIVHELCHCLLREVQEVAERGRREGFEVDTVRHAVEQTTESLTLRFMALAKAV